MVLEITKYGQKVLREKSKKVNEVDSSQRQLADDMLETMHKAKGVGLAAQQVGRLESLCVIDIPEGCDDEFDEMFNAPVKMPLKMWNPEIIQRSGSVIDKEGCLSFPNMNGEVVRAEQVTCSYIDENNKPQIITARGFLARAIQHETDHLNGVLYIDHFSAMERLAKAAKLKKISKANGSTR
ncbi:MAG: peptide deformylase [Kiritimatiellae bacterium]|nr:peptide deformylase [Kiritimatiellia bacterium]